MALCLIALPIFAILSIFSVKYRKLTKDALDCLFKTVTLRKCESGLDDRIKAQLTGQVLKFSPSAAKFIYKNYKVISWIILIIFLWSLYGSSVGIYNYYNYGNCNGPESHGFCLLDPTGANSGISELEEHEHDEIIFPVLEEGDPIIGPENAELTIIEFGCFRCPYTKKAEPIVGRVIEYYEGRVNVQFKNMILPSHELSYESGLAANCVSEQDKDKYKEYHDKLFEEQETFTYSVFSEIAEDIGLDKDQFNDCLETKKYAEEVKADNLMGIKADVHGTPTFFINDKVIVGPKPFKTFKKIIDKELKK